MIKPNYSDKIKHWSLDREMVFLNHGSFGATPTAVLQKQNEYRMQMESEPVRFMVRELEDLLWQSKTALGNFVGASAEDLVFVPNATTGVNIVLNSLKFNAGDELITTSHGYGACVNALHWFAQKANAKVVVADVPFPIADKQQVIDAVMNCITPKTKLLMIDHITSATGIIFPVEEIVPLVQAKGIDVLVDGAHVPGHLDLNIEKLNAAYYTGNCHKWICSPKGSAFLHVRRDKQGPIKPLSVSHHYDVPNSGGKLWSSHFFWPGTHDYTNFISVKDAIEVMGKIFPGGWDELKKHNRKLCVDARNMLHQKTGYELPAPENMIGNMSTILMGMTTNPPFGFNYIHPLQQKLFAEYNIEIPVITFNKNNPRLWFRISAQAYNNMQQYEYLAEVLKEVQG